MTWSSGTHSLGAEPVDDGRTRFTLWAPTSERVTLHRLEPDSLLELEPFDGGYHGATITGCPAGTRYRYVLDGERELADPASRSQPEGVHGPSQVIDLAAHQWFDDTYLARPLWDHVIYEVHVGTFTREGTFDTAIDELDDLVDLGVSAIEVMPVAQFPGRRNWGYDGVFPFAVQDSYGGASALQRFVDACHQRTLAVVLDVVYNHLGPEGNVLGVYGPYFSERYRTPWGPALNFDGPGSDDVRAYFWQNALQWFVDFHVDALRLDAVHEIVDESATSFMAELSRQTKELGRERGRRYDLIAESAANDPRVVSDVAVGGLGIDAQWNDDFHHALHVSLTHERSGYYVDYQGASDLARAMDEGFIYQGEYSHFRKHRYGAASLALAPERFVVFAQNHDQIGNRARGDRLATMITPEQARLAAALVLLTPAIPLLFMGEEYGETAPFPYFVDHGDPELIATLRLDRAREFPELADIGQLFDPAEETTFEVARLDRSLRDRSERATLRALYQELIALRRATPALRRSARHCARAWADGDVITLTRSHVEGDVVVLFNLSASDVTSRLPARFLWQNLLELAAPPSDPSASVALSPWGFSVHGAVFGAR